LQWVVVSTNSLLGYSRKAASTSVAAALAGLCKSIFITDSILLPPAFLMASQKLTNCCVAAIALVTAAYLSTPHSSTLRALHLALFA
jgi:hypothetical protein